MNVGRARQSYQRRRLAHHTEIRRPRIQCASRLRRLRSQSTTRCIQCAVVRSYARRLRRVCAAVALTSLLSSPYITYPTCLPTHSTNIHIKLQLSLISPHTTNIHIKLQHSLNDTPAAVVAVAHHFQQFVKVLTVGKIAQPRMLCQFLSSCTIFWIHLH